MTEFFWRLLERLKRSEFFGDSYHDILYDSTIDFWHNVSVGVGVVAAGYAVWKSWGDLPETLSGAFLFFMGGFFVCYLGGMLLYACVVILFRFIRSRRTHMTNPIKRAWYVERDPEIKLSLVGRIPFWATICIVMLAVAIPPTPPWRYVVIVHVVVSLYLLHVLVEKAYRVEKYGWAWVLGIAVGILQPLYNPFLVTYLEYPMLRLSVETWSYIYVATILLLLLTIWIFPKDMKFPERPSPGSQSEGPR